MHQAISDVYFDLNSFVPHNAFPDLWRAKRHLAEAYETAKKIRDIRQRNYMLADLRKDELQLWDAEDQCEAIRRA